MQGVFARPAHDPEGAFDGLLSRLQDHRRAGYLSITDCIPDYTLQEGAVVAIVCELTTKGEAALQKADLA